MKSNFAEIESEAQEIEKLKEATAVDSSTGTSAALQYKTQDRLKQVDPKKAEQMQRLGMGMTGHRGYVSHKSASSPDFRFQSK